MMQATNYYRRLKEDYSERFMNKIRAVAPAEHELYQSMLSLNDAQKFILPNGGRILDTKLRYLPDIVRLPYDEIIVEYSMTGFFNGPAERIYKESVSCSKRIAFAKQISDNLIVVNAAAFVDDIGKWCFTPFTALIHTAVDPATLSRPAFANEISENEADSCPKVGVQILPHPHLLGKESPADLEKRGMVDIGDEVAAVLSLIEALSCSNVFAETLPIKPLCRKAIKRGDKPFDEYKILSIRASESCSKDAETGIGHASPREHLRRGHIRRHPTAGNIWINSMVVNAGVGGKIHKTYKVEAA